MGRWFRVARTPLTLLVLLGILAYGAWWGWTNIWKPIPPRGPDPCVPTKVTKNQLKSSQVTVRVYNGGGKTGQAGDVGRQLREKSFNVARIGNTDQKATKTLVIGADAQDPEVRLVHGFFSNSTVRSDKRPDRSVDVVIGSKFGGFNSKAKTSIDVSSATVCLPAQPSASPSVGTG